MVSETVACQCSAGVRGFRIQEVTSQVSNTLGAKRRTLKLYRSLRIATFLAWRRLVSGEAFSETMVD